MGRKLSEPRWELIDLLESEMGRMVARRIDDASGYRVDQPDPRISAAAARMLALVQKLDRTTLEASHAHLNRFFDSMPFSPVIPIVIAIEKLWPHHIETMPAANQRLDLIRKGGEWALVFSPEKIGNVLACILDIEEER